ncbi:MAG: stage 0 sporulation family protein [Ruminococcus sp.]|nr:stage 0 sporulation family protein [Ruminococcus sp.]
MAEIIGVRFKEVGKIYYFDPIGLTFKLDEKVIVETARGVECGTVALPNKEIADDSVVYPLKPVLRKVTEKDLHHIEENKKREAEAFKICEKKIREHGLGMKLVDVEYTFDNNKILFYFTADGRVDFRALVKDLAMIFRTRIELRQIGVRDEAKMLGGLGVCGRPLCCSSFLGEFQPVSIKMAKEQGLSLSPVKISGTCGRLMCCLKYEQDAYTDLIANSPKIGSHVKTPVGNGIVIDTALLTGLVKVKMDGSIEEAAPQVFAVEQLKTLNDGVFKVIEKDDDEIPENVAQLLDDEPEEKPKQENKPRSDNNRENRQKYNSQNNRNNRKPNNTRNNGNSEKFANNAEKDYSEYKPKEKSRQRRNQPNRSNNKNYKNSNHHKNNRGEQQKPHYRKPKNDK